MDSEEVPYEILNYKSKFLKSKLPILHIFCGCHESSFPEILIYVNLPGSW